MNFWNISFFILMIVNLFCTMDWKWRSTTASDLFYYTTSVCSSARNQFIHYVASRSAAEVASSCTELNSSWTAAEARRRRAADGEPSCGVQRSVYVGVSQCVTQRERERQVPRGARSRLLTTVARSSLTIKTELAHMASSSTDRFIAGLSLCLPVL